jgi:hypothetical protein
MRRIGLGAIFALFMSLAISSYAQQLGQDSGAASQEQPKKPKEAPPKEVPPEAKSPRDQKEAKPPKTKEQETRPSSKQKPADEKHGTSAQKQPARPSGKSAHIPDAKFKADFGKQHTFTVKRVITNTTVIVPNETQFVYAGYTFIFLDPWPEDWLFTDDCYIEFVDEEYFLFNVSHPGVRVALFVAG